MSRKFLAFDLEISKPIPPGAADWKAARPLGITCAATLALDWNGAVPELFFHEDDYGEPTNGTMTREEAQDLVSHLDTLQRAGYTILGWNSLGFDFDVLAEESGMFERCAALAVDHVDMMWQFFATKGFALGLDKAAKGMGMAGKPAGMNGALCPELWEAGRYQEVLDYLAQDVLTTLGLALAVEREHAVNWISQSGRPNSCPVAQWLTVRECLSLPEPDVSHMRDPWPRSKFTGWLGDRLPAVAPTHVHKWEIVYGETGSPYYCIACDCGEEYAPRNLLRLLTKETGEQVAL